MKQRTFAEHSDIISVGDDPNHVNLFLEGRACRDKQLDDGRCQIISFFVPGDLCDSYASHLDGHLATMARLQAMILHDPGAGIDLGRLVTDELTSALGY